MGNAPILRLARTLWLMKKDHSKLEISAKINKNTIIKVYLCDERLEIKCLKIVNVKTKAIRYLDR